MIELGNLSKVDRGEKHILPSLSPPEDQEKLGRVSANEGMKGSGMRSNGSDHCS